MKIQAKTALGIEISTRHVAMALVRRERRRSVLVRAAKVRTEQDLIRDGRIQDPAGLARAVRQARSACLGMFGYAYAAGIALPVGIVQLHLLDLPDPLPSNLASYVRDEVGQFSSIPADRIVSDHGPIGPRAANRLLAAIADSGPIMDLIRPCAGSRLVIQMVEPGCLAMVRALTPYLARSQSANVLVVSLGAEGMGLCVLRAGKLDFLRSQSISETCDDPEALTRYVSSQLREVIQFYTVEAASGAQQWRICLICQDGLALSAQASTVLVPKGCRAELDVLRPEEVISAAVQCQQDASIAKDVGMAAVGLALGLLGDTSDIPKLNLLPPGVIGKRRLIRQLTITGLVVALIILAAALVEVGLVARVRVVEQAVAGRKALIRSGQAAELVSQQRQLDARIEEGSRVAQVMQELVTRHKHVDWSGLLEDIRQATPATVAISQLSAQATDQLSLVIDGYAIDYPSVRSFVDRLAQSDHVASASLVRSGVDVVYGKTHLAYQIRCVLKAKGQ